MNILSVDLGTRHTGVAFFDERIGMPLPLDTIHHASDDELVRELLLIITEKKIEHVVFGIPFLLSGDEGSQTRIVRAFAESFPYPEGVSHTFVDERYTNERRSGSPDHAGAACAILEIEHDRRKRS